MPIYEYICGSCEHEFEELQKFSDPPVKNCPSCKKRGKVQRKISAPAFHLQGGGWYADGYSGSGNNGGAGAKEEKSKSSSDGDKSSSSDSSGGSGSSGDSSSTSSTESKSQKSSDSGGKSEKAAS